MNRRQGHLWIKGPRTRIATPVPQPHAIVGYRPGRAGSDRAINQSGTRHEPCHQASAQKETSATDHSPPQTVGRIALRLVGAGANRPSRSHAAWERLRHVLWAVSESHSVTTSPPESAARPRGYPNGTIRRGQRVRPYPSRTLPRRRFPNGPSCWYPFGLTQQNLHSEGDEVQD